MGHLERSYVSMFSNVLPWLETTLKVTTITSALHIGQIYVSTCPNELPNSKGMHWGRRLHVSFAEVWPYFFDAYVHAANTATYYNQQATGEASLHSFMFPNSLGGVEHEAQHTM